MTLPPLSVTGTLESLSAVRDFVTGAAKAADLDERATYRLNLAVDEIATNVVLHGYEEAGLTGELVLSAEVDERTLTIHLDDAGAGYDPDEHDVLAELDRPIEERRIGGLGVFLARQRVDGFSYWRIGNRNRHTFMINRTIRPA